MLFPNCTPCSCHFHLSAPPIVVDCCCCLFASLRDQSRFGSGFFSIMSAVEASWRFGRYVCQLQRLHLYFCKYSGSSRGMRYDFKMLVKLPYYIEVIGMKINAIKDQLFILCKAEWCILVDTSVHKSYLCFS